MNSKTFLIVLLFVYSTNAAFSDLINVFVTLPNGNLRGRENENHYSYESIPYAEPPLGQLRFEPPQPYHRIWDETFQATQPPVNCLQWSQLIEEEDKLTGQEDCLTVNVYKPKNKLHHSFPVVVDIHGGFFMFGGASNDGHEMFMNSGKVILVKINYRLGPIGFVSTGDTILPGNLGLKDQRLALQWVRNNIAQFGGNPHKILVMGLDAGGASVHIHLMNQAFNKVATAAVSISGNALNPWAVQDGAARRAFELGRVVGCGLLDSSEELKACLKAKDASQIVRAVENFLILDYIPFTPFGPVVEPSSVKDAIITQHPIDLLKSGNFSTVRWLTSYVEQDGGYNAALFLKKEYDEHELIEELNNRWYDLAPLLLYYRDMINNIEALDEHSLKIRELYMKNEKFSTKTYPQLTRMFTDILFKTGVELSLMLQRSKTSVYAYLYSNPATSGLGQWLAKRDDIELGTVHGDDFSLIFKSSFRQQERKDEILISSSFIKMIEDFVKDGILQFGNCEFQPNIAGGNYRVMHIEREGCSNLQMKTLLFEVMNSIILTALLSLLVTVTFAQLIVELPNGKLLGRDQGLYYTYESIPYAEPPVGELRFEPPQPYKQNWTDVFDATKPAVVCAQWSQFILQPYKKTGSEDCLTVSIFKPKSESQKTFPVIANIFGGAFSFGGTVEDGAMPLMASGNVIVVKINHRVGSLGFINTGDSELPGNAGLKDQRLALRWIKDNIAYFGGQPDNVLFLGFSSGAASVHLQLMNKELEGLVKAAVSISANALDPWVVQRNNGRHYAFEVGRYVGCGQLDSSKELKKCLKTKDGLEIASALKQFLIYNYVPFAPFGPVVEPESSADPFITEHPIDIIKSGKTAQIPWLVTYTPEDGIYDAALGLLKQSNGKEIIDELNHRWYEVAPLLFFYRYQSKTVEEMDNHSRDLRQHYMGNQSFGVDTYFHFQRMVTDIMLKNATQKSIDLHRKYGKSPVYSYIYDNPANNNFAQVLAERTDILLGTGHGDDYFLMMNNPIREPLRSDEKVISWNFVKMLERFIITGKLVYDNCEFRDNVGEKQFQLVVIQRNGCHLTQVDELPATVSNHIPSTPVIYFG
ncbi:uncharacterized protein LOC133836658 [Drosophila sulfurigaster albostrigata]|uniref:uncharacterized protein LOC133836658 n=1 Tax=Drosophila sulfurigaster albostrigata TaxID=89887 RepID=UPI002D2190C5|nr:uncharacterized protein LOC133836658 [Drosophila sulfurigaster albostrigata]